MSYQKSISRCQVILLVCGRYQRSHLVNAKQNLNLMVKNFFPSIGADACNELKLNLKIPPEM